MIKKRQYKKKEPWFKKKVTKLLKEKDIDIEKEVKDDTNIESSLFIRAN